MPTIKDQDIKSIQVWESTWRRLKVKALRNETSIKNFIDMLLDHWEKTHGDKLDV